MTGEVLSRAITRARRRLLPFLLLVYVISFLDRANISFAKSQFQASAGISETAFAWGAGLFFHKLFAVCHPQQPHPAPRGRQGLDVPHCGCVGNHLHRNHVRARTHLLLCLASPAGIRRGRFLPRGHPLPHLLVSQPGARPDHRPVLFRRAPGVHLRRTALRAAPLAAGKAGLAGWQWMFLVEGSLAVVVGVWAFRHLSNRPADAQWLTEIEKVELEASLAGEEREVRSRMVPVRIS